MATSLSRKVGTPREVGRRAARWREGPEACLHLVLGGGGGLETWRRGQASGKHEIGEAAGTRQRRVRMGV